MTEANRSTETKVDLAALLRESATEIRAAGHNGWGNTCEWAAEEIVRLRSALLRIADGDPNRVYSPLGALHAAGMVMQWEADAKVARDALGGSDE